jgi:hypothetical protein
MGYAISHFTSYIGKATLTRRVASSLLGGADKHDMDTNLVVEHNFWLDPLGFVTMLCIIST